jgi:DNA repair exonuclease SbcCD ATPase subunit
MRNYVRVVTVVAVCLLPAIFAKPAAAAPNQNFGPASRDVAQSETPKVQEPKATATPVAAPKASKPDAAPLATDSAQLKKLQGELDAARAESAQAKKSAARAADLEKQNSELSAKLAAAEKKASVKPPAPTDSAEVKKLRGDLDAARAQLNDARKDAEQARKKSDARVAELEKQNADLSAKLSAAQKSAAVTASTEVPEARVMKRLREENSRLRYLLDTHVAKNPELKGQFPRSE